MWLLLAFLSAALLGFYYLTFIGMGNIGLDLTCNV